MAPRVRFDPLVLHRRGGRVAVAVDDTPSLGQEQIAISRSFPVRLVAGPDGLIRVPGHRCEGQDETSGDCYLSEASPVRTNTPWPCHLSLDQKSECASKLDGSLRICHGSENTRATETRYPVPAVAKGMSFTCHLKSTSIPVSLNRESSFCPMD